MPPTQPQPLEDSKFRTCFDQFKTKNRCQTHNKELQFICYQANCAQKGLICSQCASGRHKGHDHLQPEQFYQKYLNFYSQCYGSKELLSLTDKIEKTYQVIMQIITDFHQSFSNTIKAYFSAKNQFHIQKMNQFLFEPAFQKFENFDYESLENANQNLTNIIESNSFLAEVSHPHLKQIELQLKNLNYEQGILNTHFNRISKQLQELLLQKKSNPVVLNLSPAFINPKFYSDDHIIYIGQIQSKQPHGKGLCFYKDSSKILFGDFRKGAINGQGELHFPNGDIYMGEFQQSMKQGRGVYKWANKQNNKYEGYFHDNKRNGRGTFLWEDGSSYQGEFKNGAQHGLGTLFRASGLTEYQGEWKEGAFDGRGIQYLQNLQKFRGNFKKDKFEGNGTFYKEDSIIYGTWKNNELVSVNMVKSTLKES